VKRFPLWLGPGAVVTLVLVVAALMFLLAHRAAYQGSNGFWVWEMLAHGLLLILAVLSVVVSDRHVAFSLVATQAMLVFLSSLSEPEFLPARYLLFGSLMVQTGTLLPVTWRLPVGLVICLEFVTIQHLIEGMTKPEPETTVTGLIVLMLLLTGFLAHALQSGRTALAEVSERNDQLHASVLQLTSANTEFLEQANTASEESAASERHRITRDLHDVVGQTLTNIIMMTDASLHRKVDEPEETLKLLRWIRSQAKDGLEQTRGVLYELRALRNQRLRGLKFIKKLVDTFSRLSGIETNVEWGNLPWTFDPAQEIAVYHLVQGSLSNAFRHGQASRIDIHFQAENGVLSIMVRDNGRGGSDATPGIGQRGMEERIARWGGTVNFRNETYGYMVTATLQLKEETSGSLSDTHS